MKLATLLSAAGFELTGEFAHSINFEHASGEPVQLAFERAGLKLRSTHAARCATAPDSVRLCSALHRRRETTHMLEWKTVGSARLADGTEFVLAHHGDDWVVRVGGRTLMSSRMHDSEEALAEHAIERVADPHTLLVGGLGLGFTLRAVLDCVPGDAEVTVAELVPEVVGWNRTYLGPLTDYPLNDPRCEVVVGDVLETIQRSTRKFDVILLDVDNGPVALSNARNQRLYSEWGLRACHAALRPNGVLAVWSAGPNARFERRLALAGFDVELMRVAAREGHRGRHVLFLANRRQRT